MSIDIDDRPCELQRRTVDRLAAAGVPVALDHRARISTPGARWLLTVTDQPWVELVRCVEDGVPADPYELAGLAAILLTGKPLPGDVPVEHRPDESVMSRVGLTLRAAGFRVTLNTFPDDVCFDVCADIEITDPDADTGDATVLVSDGGILSWQRSYPRDDPEKDAATIAEDILPVLTHVSGPVSPADPPPAGPALAG